MVLIFWLGYGRGLALQVAWGWLSYGFLDVGAYFSALGIPSVGTLGQQMYSFFYFC